ncbi:MAG: hypothetical protein GEU73_08500 [Chloroflexi bacterium]|nr:hypothetical protein [Chloroflexota bacterium]
MAGPASVLAPAALAVVGVVAIALAPLPVLVAGLIAYVVGVWLQPWLVVPAAVLVLPYYLHPKEIGGVELFAAEIAILVGAAVVVGRGVGEGTRAFFLLPTGGDVTARRGQSTELDGTHGARSPAVRLPAPASIDWAVAAFLLAALLSLFVTEYPKQSLRDLRWVVLEPVLLFYIARATFSTPGRTVVTLAALSLSGALAAAVAIGSLATAGTLLDLSARATAPYLSPNHLGLFLGRTAAVTFALALFGLWTSPSATALPSGEGKPGHPLAGGGRTVGIAAWGILALVGTALLRSLSLGAWLGVGAAALALAALRGRRWLVAVSVGLTVIAVAAALTLPPERTIGRIDPASGTGLFRLQIWTASLHMLTDHPVFGIGLDNFLYAYRGGYMLPDAWEEPNISHPHNWVLHFWLALGLPGLAAAVALLCWGAIAGYRMYAHPDSPMERIVGAVSIGILADFLVHGSFDNSYFLADLAAVWWIQLALLVVWNHRRGERRRMAARSVHERHLQ